MEFCWFLRCDVRSAVLGDFLGAMFAFGYSGVRVAAFFDKLVHFLAYDVKVGVVSTEAPQSKKLREWNGISYVLWMRGRMWQIVMRICWFVV